MSSFGVRQSAENKWITSSLIDGFSSYHARNMFIRATSRFQIKRNDFGEINIISWKDIRKIPERCLHQGFLSVFWWSHFRRHNHMDPNRGSEDRTFVAWTPMDSMAWVPMVWTAIASGRIAAFLPSSPLEPPGTPMVGRRGHDTFVVAAWTTMDSCGLDPDKLNWIDKRDWSYAWTMTHRPEDSATRNQQPAKPREQRADSSGAGEQRSRQ